jgi:hypothetical protein
MIGVHGRRPPHRFVPFRTSWLGLVAYDPFWFYDSDMFGADAGAPFDPTVVPQPAEGPLTGGLQIDVEPRSAMVYVDGWYAGKVDDFSGYYHHLVLPAGIHRLDIVASDRDPLVVEVTVAPGRTTTYRGQLNRR